jgi:hypothetical protein
MNTYPTLDDVECLTPSWIVTLTYVCADQNRLRPVKVTHVINSCAAPDDLIDLLPDTAEILRSDVFPASKFGSMDESTRYRYKQQYGAYLMWLKACALEMPVGDLRAWTHYDPIFINEQVQRWAAKQE